VSKAVKQNKVWRVSSKEFAAIIARCTNFVDVHKELGYKGRSDLTILEIRDRLAKENISTAHFHRSNKKVTYALEEILVENSKYKEKQGLLRRLVSEKLLKLACSVCGLPPSWQNKPLTLQLDHINGIPTDNRLENLRIICPNCHSQTPTFCGRGKQRAVGRTPTGEVKTCAVCGKQLTGSKAFNKLYCSNKCSHMVIRKTEWPDTETLTQLVRKYPIAVIAKRYKVSDHTVSKWCKLAGIARPPRGYWSKIRAGKDPTAAPAKCPICGNDVKSCNVKYCSTDCCYQALRKVTMPTKEELLKLLEKMTAYKAAFHIGVTPSTVYSWCAKMGIERT
jgi:5-methylcytosine-specific restriction endonuclease McrA